MRGQRIGYTRVSSFDQNPERQLEQVLVDRIFTCFCAVLRSRVRASSRRRSAAETEMDFPARIAQTRTRRQGRESQKGLNRQI